MGIKVDERSFQVDLMICNGYVIDDVVFNNKYRMKNSNPNAISVYAVLFSYLLFDHQPCVI